MAASLAVYCFCLFSTMVRRRIKDIPKPTLAKVFFAYLAKLSRSPSKRM